MSLLPQEIIRRKRDGEALSAAEIKFMVAGLTDRSIGDGQMAAFAMAVFFQGMTMDERITLTQAMTQSGKIIDWSGLNLSGPVVDKHSTGGVGDKISLMLAPIVAACGGFVPMISGRGLGHTGGTLDKLDSIPGYNSTPGMALFQDTVQSVGCAIIGQTGDLAPADGRLYSIRDVTATVESIPLITASILSKKLAAGLDALVMDVKTGSGAFAAERDMALALAESICTVAAGAGLPTRALITDMGQVLGRNVGNALEVAEAVTFLQNDNPEPRTTELVLALAHEMLDLAGLEADPAAALYSGRALEVFARMVSHLGGPVDFVDATQKYLPKAAVIWPCLAQTSGVVSAMDTRRIGVAVLAMGGGRRDAADTIDPAVGLTGVCAVGRQIEKDQPLAMVHAATEADAAAAIAEITAAISVSGTADINSIILEHVDVSVDVGAG
ncbi:MAG: thymidine phosphorylase [Rhodospirillaceae bacterium]|jgi:thymidine phosphorylase|nr:thymidine phosphorylase [Rhodospirillaceae bacterium]MBT4043406.1 thymidine phosphorylase [Rhodospirillaceae bacterium]MBT4686876.1 thymidine phosphorylase [Rhodospirillaceae bacterium]MBT5081878.1 thymidine phosphorylase [Rhodospirillaceae bacterium]MBT5524884.1 thymidine phosphorylase [Rhodospirillaceae bacterium]